MSNSLIFYTDEAAQVTPNQGGMELSTSAKTIVYQYSSFEDYTTSNRMELKAVLHVLKIAAENPEKKYLVYSDSFLCYSVFF